MKTIQQPPEGVNVTLRVGEWRELARAIHGKSRFLVAMSAKVMHACKGKESQEEVSIVRPRATWCEAMLELFDIRCHLECVPKIREQIPMDNEEFYHV